MSVSPDDPDFLKNLLGPNTMNSPLMGLAMGLLQAGGPSRMPVSFGQALGQGLQTGQQFQSAGIQNAMHNIELQKAKTQLGFLNGMNQTQGTGDPNDPTSDPTYQHYLKGAMAGIPGMAEAAQNQLATLRAKERPATKDETAKFFPQGIMPGQSVVIDGYGNPKVMGESAIKTTTDPVTGQQVQMNVLTGKPIFATTARAPGDALPGPYESIAQQVANYDVKPPNSGSGRGAVYASNILARAQEINPDFNAQNYDTSLKAAKDFTTGKQGQGVKSFNVALKHLDTLSQLSDALGNGDIPTINKLSNFVKTQTGGPAPTSFNAAKQIVGDEIVKAIVGSGGGVADRETAAATINAASSPAQLKQVIETYKKLMVGQLEGLKQQYQTTTFRKDFDKFLSPEALKVMQDTPVDQGQQAAKTLTYDPTSGTFK